MRDLSITLNRQVMQLNKAAQLVIQCGIQHPAQVPQVNRRLLIPHECCNAVRGSFSGRTWPTRRASMLPLRPPLLGGRSASGLASKALVCAITLQIGASGMHRWRHSQASD
jgi:hypothetical protein